MMHKQIELPNELLLSKAIQTVSEGRAAIIPVKGNSMNPFICGNKDCVELHPPVDIKVGDIVLAKINTGQYILHRIYQFDGEKGVILMGDGNIINTEYCLRINIFAKALIRIGEKGKRKRLDSWDMVIAAKIWMHLLPVRGFLLRIFRKLCRKEAS